MLLAFILKFSSVDDIVQEISKYGDDVSLSKIDVARAFLNLNMDPEDAMKKGIEWQDNTYIDFVVMFGWVHGSAAFQCISDTIIIQSWSEHGC